MNSIVQKILRLLSQNFYIFKAAQKIVSFHNNENDAHMESNGERAFLRTHIRSAQIVFDVGANVGSWSTMAHTYNPQARIYAFEPFTPVFQELSHVFAETNAVSCYNIALADVAGTKELFAYPKASAYNSLYERELGNHLQAEVTTAAVTTLDSFCVEHAISQIDFLKIDVEGAELLVLQGARQLIEGKHIRTIQFEYGGTYIDAHVFLKDIFTFFAGTGYELHKLFPHAAVTVSYEQSLENFQYANYAAILK